MKKIFDKDISAFTMRLPPEIREMLNSQAKELGLTFTAYVRMILTERAKLVSKGILKK